MIFLWIQKNDGFIFFLFSEILKEQHLFELEHFYNIINIFTITFDHFNAWIF